MVKKNIKEIEINQERVLEFMKWINSSIRDKIQDIKFLYKQADKIVERRRQIERGEVEESNTLEWGLYGDGLGYVEKALGQKGSELLLLEKVYEKIMNKKHPCYEKLTEYEKTRYRGNKKNG